MSRAIPHSGFGLGCSKDLNYLVLPHVFAKGTYRYRKKRIYIWAARADTTTVVVPAMGRGEAYAPEFLFGLSHVPAVDGYSVYSGIFHVRQRCWVRVC